VRASVPPSPSCGTTPCPPRSESPPPAANSRAGPSRPAPPDTARPVPRAADRSSSTPFGPVPRLRPRPLAEAAPPRLPDRGGQPAQSRVPGAPLLFVAAAPLGPHAFEGAGLRSGQFAERAGAGFRRRLAPVLVSEQGGCVHEHGLDIVQVGAQAVDDHEPE